MSVRSKFSHLTEKPSFRTDRVADQIRHVVAQFLLDGIKDPRLGFVTITDVKVTKDLQVARIYYSTFGSVEEKKMTREILEECQGHIRKVIGQNLTLRYTPRVEMFEDEGLENSLRVQTLLNEIQTP